MSGRRIDDHSFWAGGKSKGSVFPEGAKVKHEGEAGDAAHLSRYEDTTEAIERVQNMGVKKAKGHNMKEGYRY